MRILLTLLLFLLISSCSTSSTNINNLDKKNISDPDKKNISDVSSIELSQDSLILTEGNKANVSAHVLYKDSTRDSALLWNSTDISIVVVNSTTGDISGVRPGVATVVGTAIKDSSKKVNITITVKSNDIITSLVRLNPNKLTLKIGETFQLTAISQNSDGTVSPNIVWKSDNTSIATVNSGLVTGINRGTVLIFAIAENNFNKKATAEITITN